MMKDVPSPTSTAPSETADQGSAPLETPEKPSGSPEVKSKAFLAKHRRALIISAVVLAACVAAVATIFGVGYGKGDNLLTQSFMEAGLREFPSAAPTISAFPSMEPSMSPSDSSAPSLSPSAAPSATPSLAPSAEPSSMPSSQPTSSGAPSSAPSSSPSSSPTQMPTFEPIPQNRDPNNPPRGYFNYDPDSKYGPKNWHRVDTSQHWLREFGSRGWGPWKNHVDDRETPITKNLCGAAKRKQSPKDLYSIAECEATHEIRTKCAVNPLSNDDAFEKLILPHKLSIVAKSRPCLNVQENGHGIGSCADYQPPMVDYPKYSAQGSDYSDMHHFDIKVPAEHTLEGEEFDAEIQMFHVHLHDERLSSIGIVIRATPDGFNEEFQYVLNQFQAVYNQHRTECIQGRGRNRARGLRAGNASLIEDDPIWDMEWNKTFSVEDQRERTLNEDFQRQGFNPYTDAFMTTMFFYRYDGSITEPPCKDITWWVMRDPMYISIEQLRQLQSILFTHVDSNCEPTSVHNEDQSVARPIQPLGSDRVIQKCEEKHFRSDESKGRPPGKQCRW
mmetsp:Transcript_5424/g.8566  ORF Transcript_5424/g.8566 Transcript_5424/m.8566 type:complete len:559 (+) Transcript_5424:71-1747(+)